MLLKQWYARGRCSSKEHAACMVLLLLTKAFITEWQEEVAVESIVTEGLLPVSQSIGEIVRIGIK